MKARVDDRRLFRSRDEIHLNVHAIQETNSFNLSDFKALGIDGVEELIATFRDAKVFGSLIEIPDSLKRKLELISSRVLDVSREYSFDSEYVKQLIPLVNQAAVLGKTYDAIVANPPYLGGKGMNGVLKTFAKNNFKESKSDLFAMFIQHGFKLAKSSGFNAMVTMQSWMFLSSFENMRQGIVNKSTIECMSHMGNGVMRIAFGTNATVFRNKHITGYKGNFSYLEAKDLNELHEPTQFPVQNERLNVVSADDFKKIPGSPIAYWVSSKIIDIFKENPKFSDNVTAAVGLQTGDNKRFLRHWFEVSITKIGFNYTNRTEAGKSDKKWFPYNKGGSYRKWYGNQLFVVNWENDGKEIIEYQEYLNSIKPPSSKMGIANNSEFYFRNSISWSFISSSYFGVRYTDDGFIFDVAGSSLFAKQELLNFILSFLCSKLTPLLLNSLNPTLNFQVGNLKNLPLPLSLLESNLSKLDKNTSSLKRFAKSDWDSFETSWNFNGLPLLKYSPQSNLIKDSYSLWIEEIRIKTDETKRIEESNNAIFIDALDLKNELSPDISEEQITLTINPKYRYSGSNLAKEELWQRFQLDTIKELISYAVGCMMDRYSLDEQGLIYAHSGNEGFDASKYKTFPADDDGIITLSDMEDLMVRDDISTRFTEFLGVAWGKETLSENLKFVADTLGSKTNELPKETIRRWISTEFFKDHLQRYKNRPIYWLFSSGKKKAFEALVYLHRYNEGTLSRMRMKYVVPLQTRISDQLKTIDDDIDSATGQERTRLTRKKKLLGEKEIELRKYDETLRHLAEQQIKLDLDDGVKVNYGKFPGLLAETKKVCGK